MHHHDYSGNVGWVLRVSLAVTLLFTAVEVWASWRSHSLSLLSDAGHNFTDALALLLAAVGVHWQRKPADEDRTFGYQRAGVVTAFVNALTLIFIAIYIFWEAAQRFISPEPVNEIWMAWTAVGAIVVNGGIMMALQSSQKHDLNVRAAFIHMLGDLLGAVAIVVCAVVIRYTGWVYLDPILSVAIGVLIVYSGIGIIRESLNILLEGLPKGMKLADISRAMSSTPGVLEVHDLHVWSLSPRVHALSSHVLIEDVPPSESNRILRALNHILAGFGIHHTTIQFEHAPCVVAGQGCCMTETAPVTICSHSH